ncbi:hypothetical+protein [Methylocapsa aurea]|uniref:NlpC/P60 family protein n=1 Tax=Methylocapsa aurea TaxID=663610 RepID=UPI003D188CF5
MTAWSNDYVGLPWRARGRDRAGLDCWGLVRLVYWERVGLSLPAYSESYATAEERAEISSVISGERASGDWREVDEPLVYDVALFRIGGLESHVGVIVGPGLMLHVTEGHDSEIVRIFAPQWAPRLSRVMRHCSMMDRARVR